MLHADERVTMSEYGSATWKISLWLCNDQVIYETFRSALRWGASAEDTFHELFVEELPDGLPFGMVKSMFIDLLGLVDWYEVESDLKGDDWDEDDEESDDDE